MFTMSTPAAWSRRAASIVRSMRTERGGSISTEITYRPSASAWRGASGGGRRVGRRAGDRCADGALAGSRLGGRRRRPARPLGDPRVDRCPHRGDVVGCRPAAAADDRRPGVEHVADHPAEVVGRAAYTNCPSTRWGRPALGRTALPAPAHRDERVEAADRPGPAVHAERRRRRLASRARAVATAGGRAVREHDVLAEGHQGHDRQVAPGPRLLDGDEQLVEMQNVSNQKVSTPPSSSPSIGSRNAARTSASAGAGPRGSAPKRPMLRPPGRRDRPRRGPRGRAARRVGPAARLGRRGRAGRAGRDWPRRWPSRWRPRPLPGTRGGSHRSAPDGSSTSSSRTARWGMPRLNSSVPIAPSNSSGPAAVRARNRARASPVVDASSAGSGRASAPPRRRPALAAGVVLELVAADPPEPEVARRRVPEVEPDTDAAGSIAIDSVSWMPARASALEQVEERAASRCGPGRPGSRAPGGCPGSARR